MFQLIFSFRRKCFTLLAAVLLFAFVSAHYAFAGIDVFRECNKNSDAVLYINVNSLNGYLEANKALDGLKAPAEKIRSLTSINIFKDVRSFVTVLTGLSNFVAAKNPYGAFILEGAFKPSEIEKKLEASGIKSEAFESVKLYAIDEDVFLAAPSEKYLLYGNSAEVKAFIMRIKGKTGEGLENNEYFKKEANAAEFKNANMMFMVKLPKELSALANSIAKVNKEQAMFLNIRGFSFSVSPASMVFKYIYETKEDASNAVPAAKDFMENGFSQLAANSKKLNGSEVDKTKVKIERVNFVKSGIELFLKFRGGMKIETADNALYIKFDTSRADPESVKFVKAAIEAFVTSVAGKEKSAAGSAD